MSTANPSKPHDAEIAGIITAIFKLDRESSGESRIVYRPAFRKLTGSTNAALLLQQIWYYFDQKNYNPFYKFLEPCKHENYRTGDSWTEELEWSAEEFRTAIEKVGTKITTGTSKTDAYKNGIVIYWTDSNRKTWYDMNLINFAKVVHEAYGKINAKPDLSVYLERLESQFIQNTDEADLPVNSSENTSENTTESTSSPKVDESDAVPPPPKKKPPLPEIDDSPDEAAPYEGVEVRIINMIRNTKHLTEPMRKNLREKVSFVHPDTNEDSQISSVFDLYQEDKAYSEWIKAVVEKRAEDKSMSRSNVIKWLVSGSGVEQFYRWRSKNVSSTYDYEVPAQ